jgi:VanZ family protein
VKNRKAFIPAFVWAVILAILSLLPNNSMPRFSWADVWSPDKFGHFLFYCIFAYLIMFGLHRQKGKFQSGQVIIIGVLGACLFGFLMECLQRIFSPSRYFELLDIIANIIGSFTAILIYKLKP